MIVRSDPEDLIFTSADGQQCHGWMLEVSGSSQQPTAKGIWYQGNCQAKAIAASDVAYNATNHQLTLTLKDEAGNNHRFSGILRDQQLFRKR